MIRPHHSPALPFALAALGMALFSAMDGVMKAAAIAVGAYTAMFWRCGVGALLMLPLWLGRKRAWPDRAVLRLHVLRSAVASVMAVAFFYGLVRTPIAEAIALSFIAPLIALYLAAVVLGERVGRRAVIASLLGLVGVGVIAAGKFGGTHDTEALKGLAAILASAVLYAGNLILQRQQAQVAEPDEIAFFQSVLVFAILGLGAPWLVVWPSASAWGAIAAAAVLAVTSLMLASWAYARAEAQALLPIEYSAFIWAVLVGWIGFGEPLTWRTLAGVVLIVTGCLIAARQGPREEAFV